MAQNVTVAGASFSDVPSVVLPKTGGGSASFLDTTIASNAAAASDIANGKLAYVNGALVTGTASGGGSSYTLLVSRDFTVNTSSTSIVDVGTITLTSAEWTTSKIIYVKVRDKAGSRSGYFVGTDAFILNVSAVRTTTNQLGNFPRFILCNNYGTLTTNGSTNYGVYTKQIDKVDGAAVITIASRYNSSISRTINGTYNVSVYALDYAPNQGNPFDYSY